MPGVRPAPPSIDRLVSCVKIFCYKEFVFLIQFILVVKFIVKRLKTYLTLHF